MNRGQLAFTFTMDNVQQLHDGLIHFRDANMDTFFQNSSLPVSKVRIIKNELIPFKQALNDILPNWDQLLVSSRPALQYLYSLFNDFLRVVDESDNYKPVLLQVGWLTKHSELIVSSIPDEVSSEDGTIF